MSRDSRQVLRETRCCQPDRSGL